MHSRHQASSLNNGTSLPIILPLRFMNEPPDPVSNESPCIKVCALDAENVCVGCGRLLQEIAEWSQMTAAERRAVRDRAAARLQVMGRSGRKRD